MKGLFSNTTLGGKRCWYCGSEFTTKAPATKDHFYPKSKGGLLKVRCCLQCNLLKADKEPLEWINFIETSPTISNLYSPEIRKRMIVATQSLWNDCRKDPVIDVVKLEQIAKSLSYHERRILKSML